MKKDPVLVDAREIVKVIDGLDLKDEVKDRIKVRWLNYVLWWSSRASKAKWKYYLLRAAVVVGGSLIPALIALRELDWGPDWLFAASSILASLVVAVCVGLEELFHFGEIWREKRAAAELIKVEGFRFFQLTEPYRAMSHKTGYPVFAERVEALIEREIKDYIVAVTPEQRPPNAGELNAGKDDQV
jgi:hypothetical protein